MTMFSEITTKWYISGEGEAFLKGGTESGGAFEKMTDLPRDEPLGRVDLSVKRIRRF